MNKIKNIGKKSIGSLSCEILFEFKDGNERKRGPIRVSHTFDSLEDKELFWNGAHWKDYFYTWAVIEDSILAKDMDGLLSSAYSEYHLVNSSEEYISIFNFVNYMLEQLKKNN